MGADTWQAMDKGTGKRLEALEGLPDCFIGLHLLTGFLPTLHVRFTIQWYLAHKKVLPLRTIQ